MKTLLLALLTVGSALGFGGRTGFPGDYQQVGIIAMDDFARADNAAVGVATVSGLTWSELASVNASIASAKLQLVGSGSQLHRVRLPLLTSAENYELELDFSMTTQSGTTFGITAGMEVETTATASAPQRGYSAQIGVNTGASLGKAILNFWEGSAFTALTSSGSAVSYTAGNEMRVIFKHLRETITATAYNLTQGGAPVAVSFTLDTDGASETNRLGPGPRYPCIWIIGGTANISRVTYRNLDYVRPDYLIPGYSITQFASASSSTNRWASLFATAISPRRVVVYAGASAVTANMQSSQAELLRYLPKRVLIGGLMGNDIHKGTASATYRTNYLNLTAAFAGVGADVWHLIDTPRDALDMTSIKTWLEASFPGKTIDTFTPLLGTGTEMNDSLSDETEGSEVHPNDVGMDAIADVVIPALP